MPREVGEDKVRLGLLLPSSNSVMEPDFYRRLPVQVTLHAARMRLLKTTVAGESAMLDVYLPEAVKDLASVKPHIVLFGCTSAGALRGNAYEAQLVERIAAETGARTYSVSACVRWALKEAGGRVLGVITPYVDEINERIRASLEDDGFQVRFIRGMGITENFAIARIPPEEICRFAVAAGRGTDIDGLFVSCTNFRGFDAREMISAELGLPVITSNQASLERVLTDLGFSGVGGRLRSVGGVP